MDNSESKRQPDKKRRRHKSRGIRRRHRHHHKHSYNSPCESCARELSIPERYEHKPLIPLQHHLWKATKEKRKSEEAAFHKQHGEVVIVVKQFKVKNKARYERFRRSVAERKALRKKAKPKYKFKGEKVDIAVNYRTPKRFLGGNTKRHVKHEAPEASNAKPLKLRNFRNLDAEKAIYSPDSLAEQDGVGVEVISKECRKVSLRDRCLKRTKPL